MTDEAGFTLHEELAGISLEAANSQRDANSPHATLCFLLDLSQMPTCHQLVI